MIVLFIIKKHNMKLEEAKKKGFRYLSTENSFTDGCMYNLWDIEKAGDFEDAFSISEEIDEKCIWIRKIEKNISGKFILDLVHAYFNEHEELFLGHAEKVSELIEGCETLSDALAAKITSNFSKQNWFEPTGHVVDFY